MDTPLILAAIVLIVPSLVFAAGVYLLMRMITKVAREAAKVADQVNRTIETLPDDFGSKR